jgi:hypothetical protein
MSRLTRFVAKALELNLPVTVANYPDGPHSFDLMDDREASRNMIRQILSFVHLQFGGAEAH